MNQSTENKQGTPRRQFLKTTAAASVAAGALGTLVVPRGVHAKEQEVIRVGLIGCGGRGTGAARDAMLADPHVQVVALGDVFEDKLQNSYKNLQRWAQQHPKHKQQFAVSKECCFVGFDAYQKVLDAGVDVVLLATPPHFRPQHLKAAVEKGVHIFAEKPVAVDAPGVRSVFETVKQAEKKGISIVSGLCWRYDYGVRETMKRVLDGMIGDVLAIHEVYNTGYLRNLARRPDWSEMEYQLRNWLYFTWLSGDHNVEQHVHSLDKGIWCMQDQAPINCVGTGGRQVRTDPNRFGHIYDHFAVCYEFANGTKMFSYCRQQSGTDRDVNDYFIGTKGFCNVLRHTITDRKGKIIWRYRGPKPSMYVNEHQALYQSIREGKPINNGRYMTISSMVAIMGRMSAYTGRKLTWEQALNSKERLGPEKYSMDADVPVPPVAMPGVTPFV